MNIYFLVTLLVLFYRIRENIWEYDDPRRASL